MKNTKQYVDNVRNGMRNFRNQIGPWVGVQNGPGGPANRPKNWNANGSGNAKPSAKPIVLNITNNTAAAVTSFSIFGAAEFLTGNYGGGSWSSGGAFTNQDVTVQSAFPEVTYQQILNNTQNAPFTVGSVYLKSISGNANQVSDPYQLTSVSSEGRKYTESIIPFLDTMQLNSNITYNTEAFNMGSMTKITWGTIYASAVFQISLFPAQIVDPNQALNGGSVNQQFGRPNIVANMRSNGGY